MITFDHIRLQLNVIVKMFDSLTDVTGAVQSGLLQTCNCGLRIARGGCVCVCWGGGGGIKAKLVIVAIERREIMFPVHVSC